MSENNHPFLHERGHNPLMDEGIGERLRQISPSYADIAEYVQSIDPRIIADGEAAAAALRQAQQEAAQDTETETAAADLATDQAPVDRKPVANLALSGVMEDAGMLADDTAEQDMAYPDSIAPDSTEAPAADNVTYLRQDNDVEPAA